MNLLHTDIFGVEISAADTKQQFEELAQSPFVGLRRRIEDLMTATRPPVFIPAYCGCCDKPTEIQLTTRHGVLTSEGGLRLAFSETGVCRDCNCNSRIRFACDIILPPLKPHDAIYLTEKKTSLFQNLQRRKFNVHGSEFLGPEKRKGATYDQIEHQDIHALTYQDNSFSALMCLDVLEHINDPLKAVSELIRVIKPGGIGVVTFPFYNRQHTVVRSQLDASGQINYLLPAELHGNPLGGGSLVFRELAWDFIDTVIKDFTRSQVRFVTYWSLYRAHFGPSRFALILTP